MIRISLENFNSKEKFLQLRRSGVGGSDASTIAGVNKYKSEIELWLEKTGKVELEDEESEVTYWGTVLEDVIREEFNKRTGLNAVKPKYMYRSEEYPFMIANLDAELEDEYYGKCLLEIKTASAFKKDEWSDGIPLAYFLQIQHYLLVTGYDGAFIAVLIGGQEFLYRYVDRDPETIDMLIKLEKAFWDKVTSGEEPDIDGSEASKKFMAAKYPVATKEEPVELGDERAALLLHYDEALKQETRAKEVKVYIENRLKDMLQDHESGFANGRKVTWKNVTTRRLDSKLLKVSEPDIYEEYSYDSTSRRFLVA